MTQPERPIAIPWKVRLQYLSTYWLQGILFAVSLLALTWLWTRRSPGLVVKGQVEAVQVSVPATGDGVLMPLAQPLVPFDRVQRNVSLVARLDVSDALMEMQVLTAERERLQAMIAAESERLRIEQQQWQLDKDQQLLTRQRNLASAAQQLDDLRREINDLRQRRRAIVLKQAELESAQKTVALEWKNLKNQHRRLSDLVQRRLAPAYRLAELDEQMELKRTVTTENEALLNKLGLQLAEVDVESTGARRRLTQATENLEALRQQHTVPPATPPDEAMVDVETSLQPLVKALEVQDAKVRKLAQRIASNEILAPVSGMISKVHHPPGTYVRSGDPIVTISSAQAGWIVTYVDQQFGRTLRKDDKVRVRVIGDITVVAEAKVTELGTQYQPMPQPMRRAADVPQWGLPVKVSIPSALPLLPGEMVELVFASPDRSRTTL